MITLSTCSPHLYPKGDIKLVICRTVRYVRVVQNWKCALCLTAVSIAQSIALTLTSLLALTPSHLCISFSVPSSQYRSGYMLHRATCSFILFFIEQLLNPSSSVSSLHLLHHKGPLHIDLFLSSSPDTHTNICRGPFTQWLRLR